MRKLNIDIIEQELKEKGYVFTGDYNYYGSETSYAYKNPLVFDDNYVNPFGFNLFEDCIENQYEKNDEYLDLDENGKELYRKLTKNDRFTQYVGFLNSLIDGIADRSISIEEFIKRAKIPMKDLVYYNSIVKHNSKVVSKFNSRIALYANVSLPYVNSGRYRIQYKDSNGDLYTASENLEKIAEKILRNSGLLVNSRNMRYALGELMNGRLYVSDKITYSKYSNNGPIYEKIKK